MIKGLLKSFFLHLLIVGLFIYGSEIFKNNKRFEIKEIPLDIIDISDQTITKTEKKIKEKAAKKKQQKNQGGFQPPKVKSKPKPPEFAKKDNVTKKKKEIIKDNKEEQKQKKRVDNILKSIEKIKSEKKKQLAKTEDLEEEKDLDENKKEKSINLGEKLTISEKDAIRRQFYKCWIVPAGAKNIKDYKVSIRLKLNEEGEVIYSKIINNSQINNTFFRTLAESAVRAVNHPVCKRLKVPKKKYETWKETILDFDPSVMIN